MPRPVRWWVERRDGGRVFVYGVWDGRSDVGSVIRGGRIVFLEQLSLVSEVEHGAETEAASAFAFPVPCCAAAAPLNWIAYGRSTTTCGCYWLLLYFCQQLR
jgi:hypothetical protein